MAALKSAYPKLNIALWISQILLALLYCGVGFMKLTQPIPELASTMTFVNIFPEWFVRFLGVAELAGGLGLILPMLTKVLPKLTLAAALGLVVVQIGAIVYHVSQSEMSVLGMNVLLLALAGFIFWGRRTKLPL